MTAPGPEDADAFCLDVALALGRDGRSRLAHRRVRYPWSLGRGYSANTRAGAATLIPQAAAAGLLPGDAHRQRARVAPGASARLVSAGATMVYAPRARDAQSSATTWRFEIGAGAALVNVSEPYVLYGPARLHARQTVAIAETGRFVTWDGVVFAVGSTAAWTSEFVVESLDGAALLTDAQRAESGALARHGRLKGAWSAFASIYALAPPSRLAALKRAAPADEPMTQTGLYAASALLRGNRGLGVRVVARDGGLLRRACHAIAGRLSHALELDYAVEPF